MEATVRDITDLAVGLLDDLNSAVFPADTVLRMLEPRVNASMSNYTRLDARLGLVDAFAPACQRNISFVRAWCRANPDNAWFAMMSRRDRVPVTGATAWGGDAEWRREPVREVVTAITGCDELAVLPLTARSGDVTGLTFGRRGRDFTASELDLLTAVQPLLRAVARYVDRMTCWREQLPDAAGALTACRDARLTARELDVLGLLAEGLTAASVARRLGCAHRTAEKHTSNIYRKLDVNDRVSAVLEGQRRGLLPARRPPTAPPPAATPSAARVATADR